MCVCVARVTSSPPPHPLTYTSPTPSQVVQLMGVDLLRQQQCWKDSLMEIRHVIASLIQVTPHPSPSLPGMVTEKEECVQEQLIVTNFYFLLLWGPVNHWTYRRKEEFFLFVLFCFVRFVLFCFVLFCFVLFCF